MNILDRLLAENGWRLLALTGWILFGAGVFAIVSAANGVLLPHDTRFLGMTSQELCGVNACRVVHFMSHDRVSFGGSIMAIGVLYHFLATGPLRAKEPWALFVFAISGAVGFASFLAYLGYGYLDTWHGWATLGLLVVYLAGMWGAARSIRSWPGFRNVLAPAWPVELRTPLGWGRAFLVGASVGLVAAGATIMTIGMTTVFVPQDLEYMQITVEELRGLNPRLVPLIAHDRAGFGGGVCSGGLAMLGITWCGARHNTPRLWRALFLAGAIGFTTSIGVHPLIGYNSFSHLAPSYLGAITFAMGIAILYRPQHAQESGSVEAHRTQPQGVAYD